MTPGARLKSWREARGLSQKEAAQQLGVSQAAWCEYENDEKLPRVQQAVAIARLTAGDPNAVTVEMFAAAEEERSAKRRVDESADDLPAAVPTGTDPHTG